jgi:hypothetical protein
VDPQEVRQRFVKSLLDKIDGTQFPSNELLGRVESSLTSEEELAEYAEILLKKVENTKFPSNEILMRLEGVVQQLEAAGDRG